MTWNLEDHDRLIDLADGKMELVYDILREGPSAKDVGGNYYDVFQELRELGATIEALKYSLMKLGLKEELGI